MLLKLWKNLREKKEESDVRVGDLVKWKGEPMGLYTDDEGKVLLIVEATTFIAGDIIYSCKVVRHTHEDVVGLTFYFTRDRITLVENC